MPVGAFRAKEDPKMFHGVVSSSLGGARSMIWFMPPMLLFPAFLSLSFNIVYFLTFLAMALLTLNPVECSGIDFTVSSPL